MGDVSGRLIAVQVEVHRYHALAAGEAEGAKGGYARTRLVEPQQGVAALGTYNCGQTMVGVNLYLYGDQAAANVARETPLWQAWIQERFPMPSETSQSA